MAAFRQMYAQKISSEPQLHGGKALLMLGVRGQNKLHLYKKMYILTADKENCQIKKIPGWNGGHSVGLPLVRGEDKR